MPDAVRHHARGEGIPRIGQPVGQRAAAARRISAIRRRDLGVGWIENREESRLDFLFQCVIHANRQHVRLGRVLAIVDHGLRDGRFGRLDVVEFGQFGAELHPTLLVLAPQPLGGVVRVVFELGLGLVVHLPLNRCALFGGRVDGILDFRRELVEVFFVQLG